jgi:hypothetical protein
LNSKLNWIPLSRAEVRLARAAMRHVLPEETAIKPAKFGRDPMKPEIVHARRQGAMKYAGMPCRRRALILTGSARLAG